MVKGKYETIYTENKELRKEVADLVLELELKDWEIEVNIK